MPRLFVESEKLRFEPDDGLAVRQAFKSNGIPPQPALLLAEIEDEGPLGRQERDPGLGGEIIPRPVPEQICQIILPLFPRQDAVEINHLGPIYLLPLPSLIFLGQVRELGCRELIHLVQTDEDVLDVPVIPAAALFEKGETKVALGLPAPGVKVTM